MRIHCPQLQVILLFLNLSANRILCILLGLRKNIYLYFYAGYLSSVTFVGHYILVCSLFYETASIFQNITSNVIKITKQSRVRIWKPVTVEVPSESLLGVTEKRHALFQLW